MPELKHICAGNELCKLSDVVGIEVLVVVCRIHAVTDLVSGEVCQQTAENLESPVGIAHVAHCKDLVLAELRNALGNIQTSLV